jgi:hypothetical protein
MPPRAKTTLVSIDLNIAYAFRIWKQTAPAAVQSQGAPREFYYQITNRLQNTFPQLLKSWLQEETGVVRQRASLRAESSHPAQTGVEGKAENSGTGGCGAGGRLAVSVRKTSAGMQQSHSLQSACWESTASHHVNFYINYSNNVTLQKIWKAYKSTKRHKKQLPPISLSKKLLLTDTHISVQMMFCAHFCLIKSPFILL